MISNPILQCGIIRYALTGKWLELLNIEKPKEIKDTEKSEKVLEKQETTVENKAQVLEESKKEDLKQEEIKKEEVKTEELKKEEPKKEEVKKVNRKYSEEVIRKSLGLGVKLKSKTK